MTEKLREALHETAERGRTATLPDTLWADAQRARKRDRIVLPVLALLLIAGLGVGFGVLTQSRHEAGPADGNDLGVPSHVYGMTNSSENGGWGYQGLPPVADDFQVGTSAALLQTLEGTWAVVSAEDGSYHLLPRPPSSLRNELKLVLSAQGDRVAWSQGARKGGVLRISVADLATGLIKRYPIRPARVPSGTRDLTWSASGRYLAFRTSEARPSDRDGSSSLFRLYVLDTRTGEVSSRTRWGDTVVPLAATDDGGVAIILDALQIWRPGHGVVVGNSSSQVASAIAISPDGSLLAKSDFLTEQDAADGGGPSISFLPTGPDDAEAAPVEFSGDDDARVLGWTKDGQAVALVGDPRSPSTAELTLVDVDKSKARVVGTIDIFGVDEAQIATALITSDRPTVDRGEPSWVDHDFPWWRAVGFSLVIGLLLLAVLNVRRRRMAG